MGLVYFEYFLTMPARTHPRKVGFSDRGKGWPLSNPFEVVKTDPNGRLQRKKAAIAGGLSRYWEKD